MKKPKTPIREEDVSVEEGLLTGRSVKANVDDNDHGRGHIRLRSDDLSDAEIGGPSAPTSPTQVK